jgi:hypothetical protein
MVKIYISSTPTSNLRIIGQDGNFILVDGKDLGTLSTTTSNDENILRNRPLHFVHAICVQAPR